MKRLMIALVTMVCFLSIADDKDGVDYVRRFEIVGTTNYIGQAKFYVGTTPPTESDAKWHIIKIVYDSSGNVSEFKKANASGTTWSSVLYGTAWTNRVNATYK